MTFTRFYSRKVFHFDTDKERDILEGARKYFHDASTLMIKGWGRKILNESCGSAFYNIKKGNGTAGKCYISLRNWLETQIYASRAENGERYDSETFQRPNVVIDMWKTRANQRNS